MIIAFLIAVVALAALHAVLAERRVERAEAALRDLVERVGTTPRLELRPPAPTPAPAPEANYISDEPYHDGVWNEYTGETPRDDDDPRNAEMIAS